MWRHGLLVLGLFACDEGTKSKVKETANKVDKAADKLDSDDARDHLAKARAALASGTDPAEDCSWLARQTDSAATKPALDELRRVCSFDAPLARAKQAVVRAETARAEVPEAPTLTECQSDDWPAMKTKLDGSPNASDAAWTDLKARWAKVCPN